MKTTICEIRGGGLKPTPMLQLLLVSLACSLHWLVLQVDDRKRDLDDLPIYIDIFEDNGDSPRNSK